MKRIWSLILNLVIICLNIGFLMTVTYIYIYIYIFIFFIFFYFIYIYIQHNIHDKVYRKKNGKVDIIYRHIYN